MIGSLRSLFAPAAVARELAAESPVIVMARGHTGSRVLAIALQHLGIRMGAQDVVPSGDMQDRRFSRTIKNVGIATVHEDATADTRARLLRSLRRSAARYMRWVGGGDTAGSWGWKFPETYLIPQYVAEAFPRARYVHLVRDGRDVAFKRHLTDDPRRILGKRVLDRCGARYAAPHLRAALSWEFQLTRYDDYARETNANVHTITFESLCREPHATMRGVCDFLQRDMTAACAGYLSSDIDASKVAQYRREDPVRVAEVEAVVGGTLARYGYLT